MMDVLTARIPLAHVPPVLMFLVGLATSCPSRGDIAAHVNGVPITVHEVHREVESAFANREIAPEAKNELLAHALEQLISRRLVLKWLAQTNQHANDAEVESAITQLKKQLEQRGGSLQEFLDRQKLDDAGLRRSLAWQIGWRRYLNEHLTDANLEKYFHRHRREFDGTELRVAHILFAVAEPAKAESVAECRKKAIEVWERIQAKELNFEQAVNEFSQSPSREQKGDIGFIGRRAPMPEPFSRAAFELEVGQVSQPVVTHFGVHLIQCLEVRPGPKNWHEVRGDLELAVTQYLFRWAADQVRATTKIEYSAEFPHFQPGTEILESRPSS